MKPRSFTDGNGARSLTVFFDGDCGLCWRIRRWLENQEQRTPLRFIDFRSHEARLIFPDIEFFQPDKEILVLANTGDLYRGADGWAACLWATKQHRRWAGRMAAEPLRSIAKQVVLGVAQNRLALSKVLGWNREEAARAGETTVDEPTTAKA